MREYIDFTASLNIGYASDVTLKTLRRELTRFSKVVPPHARITLEKVESQSGGSFYRQLVARWNQYV